MSLINLIEAEKYRAGNTSVWNIALQKAIEIIRQHQAEPPQDTAERIRVAVNKWVLEPNGLGKNGGKTMVNCDFDILIKMITQAMGASGLMASTGDGGVCGNKTNTASLEAPTIIDYADADKIAQRDDVAAMKNYTPADKTANRETGISNLGDARGSGSLPDGVATNSTLIQRIAKTLHYPDCWDTAAYPSIYDAISELAGCIGCSECNQGGKRPDADQKPNCGEIPVDYYKGLETAICDELCHLIKIEAIAVKINAEQITTRIMSHIISRSTVATKREQREIQAVAADDEDLIERLFWEFDDRRKKQGEERLTFKSKMRYFASHILRKQEREFVTVECAGQVDPHMSPVKYAFIVPPKSKWRVGAAYQITKIENGTQREYSKHLPPETKNRLEQLEAHMDEGGKTDNSIVYELLGYIKELTANGE